MLCRCKGLNYVNKQKADEKEQMSSQVLESAWIPRLRLQQGVGCCRAPTPVMPEGRNIFSSSNFRWVPTSIYVVPKKCRSLYSFISRVCLRKVFVSTTSCRWARESPLEAGGVSWVTWVPWVTCAGFCTSALLGGRQHRQCPGLHCPIKDKIHLIIEQYIKKKKKRIHIGQIWLHVLAGD